MRYRLHRTEDERRPLGRVTAVKDVRTFHQNERAGGHQHEEADRPRGDGLPNTGDPEQDVSQNRKQYRRQDDSVGGLTLSMPYIAVRLATHRRSATRPTTVIDRATTPLKAKREFLSASGGVQPEQPDDPGY